MSKKDKKAGKNSESSVRRLKLVVTATANIRCFRNQRYPPEISLNTQRSKVSGGRSARPLKTYCHSSVRAICNKDNSKAAPTHRVGQRDGPLLPVHKEIHQLL